MGATVVDTSLNLANWTKNKPSDYKGTDLDTALKAYEAVKKKSVTMPAQLPTPPASSVSGLEKCIKEIQSVVTDMQKGVTYLKELSTGLQKVGTAASKTAGDLQKLAKDKDGQSKKEYMNAATVASGMGSQAASLVKQLK